MLQLETIEQIYNCNIGGINKIELTELSNIKLDGTFDNPAQVYTITWRRNTAQFSEQSSRSSSGNSAKQQITAFIPKNRFAVEHMIRTLFNKKIAVKATDRNDTAHYIFGARFGYKYETGEERISNNGYAITLSGSTTKKPFQVGLITALIGDNGSIEGDPGPGSEEPGGGDPESLEGCCVTINPTQLTYIPADTGNVNNLSEVVTGQDGNIYFIDKNGLSIKLKDAPYRQDITGTGTSFALDTELQDLDTSEIMVIRNGVVLLPVETPTAIGHYGITGTNITLPASWALEATEYISIYKI